MKTLLWAKPAEKRAADQSGVEVGPLIVDIDTTPLFLRPRVKGGVLSSDSGLVCSAHCRQRVDRHGFSGKH